MAWLDDAIELLSTMPFTCALDVVHAYPDGLSAGAVGWIYGVTEQAIERETNKPHVRATLAELRDHKGNDDA